MPPNPRKGESKQDFLKRCVAAERKAGQPDAKAFAVCAGASREMALADMDMVALKGAVTLSEPEQNGEADAPVRFAMLGYTGKVIDWGWWRFVIDLKGIECKAAIPALREHKRDRVAGTIDSHKIDAAGMHLFGRFSQATADGREVQALAQEGFPWQSSIGVTAREIRMLEPGQTAKVNGMTVEGPLEIWSKSIVGECSFVSLGADDDTAAITMSSKMEEPMNKRLFKLLVKMGMPETATQEEAEVFLTGLGEAGQELAAACDAGDEGGDGSKQSPHSHNLNFGAPAGGPAPAPAAADTAAVQAAVQTALAAERTRVAEIGQLVAKLHLPQSIAQELAANGATIEMARERVLTELAKQNPSVGTAGYGSAEFGMDESDKFRALAAEGIMLRSGGRVEKPQAGSNEFRAMSLVDFARLSLERAGMSTRGMSGRAVAQAIMGRTSAQLAASVSDFKHVFMDVANKRLLAAYKEAAQTWRPIVTIVPATDFKNIHGISLSEAPELLPVGESDEYTDASLRDKQEQYAVRKYGRIMNLTWEMIVNDDLRAFTRIPTMFGASSARLLSDLVWGKLLSNPVMADGKPLFDEARGNLEKTTKGKISTATLSAGRQVMRKAKGMDGKFIDVQPRYLLVPVEQETDAEVLLRSTALPEANMSQGVHNPWANKLVPISDPRMEDAAAWYLVADPSQVDTIEVAFLDGREEPEVFEEEKFRADAISYKARMVCGVGVMDTVGFYKNPGK